MNKARKALYIASWVPVALVKIALTLIGLVVVPIGLLTQRMSYKKGHTVDGNHWPDILWLWGNDEEWVPEWWFVRADQEWYTRYIPRFWWLAIRNPVGNLRFLFKDRDAHIESNWDQALPMEAELMLKKEQESAYCWSWAGPFAGYRLVWLNGFAVAFDTTDRDNPKRIGAIADSYHEFWFGWKLGSGVPGLGFTMQVRLKREIGK